MDLLKFPECKSDWIGIWISQIFSGSHMALPSRTNYFFVNKYVAPTPSILPFLPPASKHIIYMMTSCELNPVEIHEMLSLLESDLHFNSGSGSSDQPRLARMISNRESAKRSRQRKKRHLEELNHQLNQLRHTNQHLKNRLNWLLHQCPTLLKENHQLGYECILLQSKLSALCQLLVNMHAVSISMNVNHLADSCVSELYVTNFGL